MNHAKSIFKNKVSKQKNVRLTQFDHKLLLRGKILVGLKAEVQL